MIFGNGSQTNKDAQPNESAPLRVTLQNSHQKIDSEGRKRDDQIIIIKDSTVNGEARQKRGERGQLLYDSASKTRYEIPAYPANLVNPTGVGDAFCAGFLAG